MDLVGAEPPEEPSPISATGQDAVPARVSPLVAVCIPLAAGDLHPADVLARHHGEGEDLRLVVGERPDAAGILGEQEILPSAQGNGPTVTSTQLGGWKNWKTR